MGNFLFGSSPPLPRVPPEEKFHQLAVLSGFSRAQCRRFYFRWLEFNPDPRTGIVKYDSIVSKLDEEQRKKIILLGHVLRTIFRFFHGQNEDDEMQFDGFLKFLALFRKPEKSEYYDLSKPNNLEMKAAFLFDVMDLDHDGTITEFEIRILLNFYTKSTGNKYEQKNTARKMLGGQNSIGFKDFLHLLEFGVESPLLDLSQAMSVGFVRGLGD